MSNKVEYTFHVDKADHKYALKVDTVTGKKSRVNYKIAQKRARDLVYRRKRAAIEQELKGTGITYKEHVVIKEKLKASGSGATFSEYVINVEGIKKQIAASRVKSGKKPLNEPTLKARAKKITIEDRSGIATRIRYAWLYTVVVERYIDEETGKLVVECDTSVFRARSLKIDGDHFTQAVKVAQAAYDKVTALDLCTLDGGACVVLYDKYDKEVIKQFELEKGCGFSFDFKNYDHDDVEEYSEEDGYNWV